eukprot:TRINITY_DN746_c0_g1_i1.p1 TRINITY_DN746_c0_g1~~TRINITY_DN746_c0_g1_i1.p1  ORF type:complete len:356 (-),score=26.13 TRINITY_DN746_c0_g1_i1:220-1287(-)
MYASEDEFDPIPDEDEEIADMVALLREDLPLKAWIEDEGGAFKPKHKSADGLERKFSEDSVYTAPSRHNSVETGPEYLQPATPSLQELGSPDLEGGRRLEVAWPCSEDEAGDLEDGKPRRWSLTEWPTMERWPATFPVLNKPKRPRRKSTPARLRAPKAIRPALPACDDEEWSLPGTVACVLLGVLCLVVVFSLGVGVARRESTWSEFPGLEQEEHSAAPQAAYAEVTPKPDVAEVTDDLSSTSELTVGPVLGEEVCNSLIGEWVECLQDAWGRDKFWLENALLRLQEKRISRRVIQMKLAPACRHKKTRQHVRERPSRETAIALQDYLVMHLHSESAKETNKEQIRRAIQRRGG